MPLLCELLGEKEKVALWAYVLTQSYHPLVKLGIANEFQNTYLDVLFFPSPSLIGIERTPRLFCKKKLKKLKYKKPCVSFFLITFMKWFLFFSKIGKTNLSLTIVLAYLSSPSYMHLDFVLYYYVWNILILVKSLLPFLLVSWQLCNDLLLSLLAYVKNVCQGGVHSVI